MSWEGGRRSRRRQECVGAAGKQRQRVVERGGGAMGTGCGVAKLRAERESR